MITLSTSILESIGNGIWGWLVGLTMSWLVSLVLVILASMYIFQKLYDILVEKLRQRAIQTPTEVDDKLYEKFKGIPMWYFFVIVSWLIATIFTKSQTGAEVFAQSIGYKLLSLFALVIIALQISRFVELIVYWFEVLKLQRNPQHFIDQTRIGLWSLVIRIGLWVFAFMSCLTVFGLRIETVLGAAGVASIVIALAMQGVLSDLFSSFMIYIDRPFRVGDLVSVNNGTKGTVKRVGMKTTRIEMLTGEELVIANSKLLASEIQNYRRMERRRAEFKLFLDTTTSSLKMQTLQKKIQAWFKRQNIVLVHDAFLSIQQGSLVFEGVYVLLDTEYESYIKTQEKINFFLLKTVSDLKIKLK